MASPTSSLFSKLIKLVILGSLGIALFMGLSWWWQTRPLEQVKLSEVELQEVEMQVKPVIESLKKGIAPPTTTIELSARQLNGYINHISSYGSKVKFDFQDGYISTEVIDILPENAPALAGKKVRVTFKLTALVADGKLTLSVSDVSCFGFGVPSSWVNEYTERDILPMIQERLGLGESVNNVSAVSINKETIKLDFGDNTSLLTERSFGD